jgi:hypothetical protein
MTCQALPYPTMPRLAKCCLAKRCVALAGLAFFRVPCLAYFCLSLSSIALICCPPRIDFISLILFPSVTTLQHGAIAILIPLKGEKMGRDEQQIKAENWLTPNTTSPCIVSFPILTERWKRFPSYKISRGAECTDYTELRFNCPKN